MFRILQGNVGIRIWAKVNDFFDDCIVIIYKKTLKSTNTTMVCLRGCTKSIKI